MAAPVDSLAILGHSFIEGTYRHLQGSQHHCTSSYIAKKMQLENLVKRVYMCGQRGSTVVKSAKTKGSYILPASLLKRETPTLAVLELGTNDLASGAPPLEVATAIMDIANCLVEEYGLKHVTVCQIINRKSGIGHLTPAQFAELAYKTNMYLKNICEGESTLSYHVHQGFWADEDMTWSRDGIHPNSARGRKLYIKSLRRSVFKAITQVKRTTKKL